MKRCLEGIRVLELSQFIAAPFCGQFLADLGAEVYKVELPGEGRGDIARKYDPIYQDMSLYFASYNRNKKFITIDLKQPEGREIFLDLVKQSHIVLENFRPGVMKKLGIDYPTLKEVNPGIILASVSGFGQEGPNVNTQALDMTLQAWSGIMDLTGFPDAPPTKVGPALSDFFGGIFITAGVLAANTYRMNTGLGQHIDLALFDAMFVLHENFPSIYQMDGSLPKRSGNGRPISAPVGTYLCKDGAWLQISATAENHFSKLAQLIGKPEWIGRPDMVGAAVRKKSYEMIDTYINQWIGELTIEEARAALDAVGVPNGVVQTCEQVYNSEQVSFRQMLIRPEESVTGDLKMIANPIKMSETPAEYLRSAMPAGYDNETTFQNLLGFDQEKLADLKARGII